MCSLNFWSYQNLSSFHLLPIDSTLILLFSGGHFLSFKNGTEGRSSIGNLYTGYVCRIPIMNALTAEMVNSRIAEMLRLHDSNLPFFTRKKAECSTFVNKSISSPGLLGIAIFDSLVSKNSAPSIPKRPTAASCSQVITRRRGHLYPDS